MNTALKIVAIEDPEVDGYVTEEAGTVRREQGLTPNGNPIANRWVYRNATGEFIDFDGNRHDLFEHNRLRLV
jgi:hypothetical protein